MTNPSIARRIVGAALLMAGLGIGSVTVVASTTVAAAPAPAAPNVVGLRKGAYGDAVKALQEALVRVGIGVKYGVDSYFGSATEASVKAFQRIKGLAMTGVVDAATASLLGLAAAPAPAPAPTAAAAPAAAPAAGLVGLGSTGPLVVQVQQALIRFGFPVASGADGTFSASTERALKAFQRANGLGVSGRTYPATLRVLGVSATPAAVAAPAPAATTVVGLAVGARGPAVAELQKAIIAIGWTLRGGADGIFGPSTHAALRGIQTSNGIPVSGTVDDATARLLGLGGGASPATGTTAAGFAAYGERGARVVALQQALINAGIAVRGGADGVFGSGTASAVMAFQRAKGVRATGKVDEATAATLGLAAAPAPTAPAVDIRLEAKPVQGPCYFGDTWNAARGNGRVHLGTDILAAEGSPAFAVVTGKVTQIYTNAPRSGNAIKVARPDGTYFFYAHLSALAPGMAVGVPVAAGQVIGYVGRTGNAATPHLHLEVHPLGGTAINPYPIVKAFGAC